MAKKTVSLIPDTRKVLEKMGANIKRARLRRNINADILAEQAKISTDTLLSIEKGMPTVSIGAYAAVLSVLGLDKDFEIIALDEEGKKEFREQNIQRRQRASRRKEGEN